MFIVQYFSLISSNRYTVKTAGNCTPNVQSRFMCYV